MLIGITENYETVVLGVPHGEFSFSNKDEIEAEIMDWKSALNKFSIMFNAKFRPSATWEI